MNELPWNERVNMLSINPDAATREDVARMAADVSDVLKIETIAAELEQRKEIALSIISAIGDTRQLSSVEISSILYDIQQALNGGYR